MNINSERLLQDLRELSNIGRDSNGLHRQSFSSADMEARKWLCGRFSEAGLEAMIDNAGNAFGKMADRKRAILIGSHTDTVPDGGWLDGSLGVIYGLEVARALRESGRLGQTGVDVVSFTEEEGAFLAEYGCRVFCGHDVAAEAANARNQSGVRLNDAIEASGVLSNPQLRLDPQRHVAYLEAHIEQGPQLEARKLQIGVVSGIVGIRSFRVELQGKADHAGTTPMSMRNDAGAAALRFGARIMEEFRKAGSAESVWNVGNVDFTPGAVSVVPGAARVSLQFRDRSSDILNTFEEVARRLVREAAEEFRVEWECSRILDIPPTPMDPRVMKIFESSAQEAGVPYMHIQSGAGHDAMIMARHLPTGMMFVPSIGGRSHHHSENTSDEDIIAGANTMLRAALKAAHEFG